MSDHITQPLRFDRQTRNKNLDIPAFSYTEFLQRVTKSLICSFVILSRGKQLFNDNSENRYLMSDLITQPLRFDRQTRNKNLDIPAFCYTEFLQGVTASLICSFVMVSKGKQLSKDNPNNRYLMSDHITHLLRFDHPTETKKPRYINLSLY